ncbi:type IV secretion system protein [Nocardioides okcheonensis]|uniref:type IV secretion system protein n=1 Tax=Nocardioides okcheonensis TaxID=2894081 RepID=UPI001E59F8AB|nr:type IV secretion system protein [Nocardioides okcheonensis]UFN45197.1 type IV secretion system protein [Nocardioides okcheonensis]
MPHTDRAQPPAGDSLHGGWSRRRLVAILAGAGLAANVLAAAFGYGVYRAVTQATDPQAVDPAHSETMAADDAHPAPESYGAPGRQRRDAIAAAPMLVVPPSAAHPPADTDGFSEPGPTTTGAPSIEIPAGDAVPGPALVMSGFPHTSQGAVAQLAQIDVAVLQSMNLTTAREVHDAWALPGGASPEQWWITASVRAFLDAASMPGAKDPAVWVQVEPAAAMVKGTDGPDWSTVCVLLRVSASYRSQGEVAFGHCERMQWMGERWMIAPGTPPASAPSTWPDTDLALQAGWARWQTVATPSVKPEPESALGVRPTEAESRDGSSPRRAGEQSDCLTTALSCSHGPTNLDGPGGRGARGTAKVDLPDIDLPGIDLPDLNPLDDLGSVIAKAAADAWTSAMMAVWASGLFVLRVVLTFAEAFLTPDLSADGPGRDVYAFTLWLAGGLATILVLVQLGRAAFTREGKQLARAAIGAGQFVLAYACWLGYCSILVAACGTLSRALMGSLLGVQTWPEFDPLDGFSAEDIADAGTATVLAFLGVFLWLAAIGHILVYLARAASLLVLAATGPVAAAGLVADSTRSWFWKSLRWFHAAALTPVLMVLVLGIGVQFASGVAASMAGGAQQAVATALPAVMLILVSTIAPMALFKLLAFVDPGTPSGASFRQGMAAAGGVQGLLTGKASAGPGGSTAASADGTGRSSGEQGAEEATGARFSKATQGAAGLLGPVGQAAAAGIGVVTKAGALAASLISDQTNQAGAGQGTYGPDFSSLGTRAGRSGLPSAPGPAAHMSHRDGDEDGDGSGPAGRDGGSGPAGKGGGSSSAPAPYLPRDPAFPQGSPLPGVAPTSPLPPAGTGTASGSSGSSGAEAGGAARSATGGAAGAGGPAGGAAAGTGAAVPIPPIA